MLTSKTLILLVLSLLLIVWLYVIFSDISSEEDDILFSPGASLLRESPDEDELYERMLSAADPPSVVVAQKEVDADPDKDDDEDERYERELVSDEKEILEAGLPKFFHSKERVEEEESEEVIEDKREEEVAKEKGDKEEKVTAVNAGKGGGGFVSYNRGDVIFSEIAWMGTSESASHEWIELKNTTDEKILLAGFSIVKGDESILVGERGDKFGHAHQIPAGGYFLLERNEEATSRAADKLYDGSLNNGGETLILKDGAGNEIDRIDMASGWQAGRNEVTEDGYKPTMSNFGNFDSRVWEDGIPTPHSDNEALPLIQEGKPKNAPRAYPSGVVLINEIAWMGDERSPSNEWIELYNTSTSTIDLSGWTLLAGDGTPSISLSGMILPKHYFLLERSDDDAVEGVAADLIYTGALENEGETLSLKDATGNEVDRVDAWHAGDNETKNTMQREDDAWFSASPTPRAQNARDIIHELPSFPHATSTEATTSFGLHDVVINEIAWMGTIASANDEWIELKNTTSNAINLLGWKLRFAKNASSTADGEIIFDEEDTIEAGLFLLLKRNTSSTIQTISGKVYTGNQMNNKGEYLSLVDNKGNRIDEVNGASSGWPAGENKTSPEIKRSSMERSGDFTAWYTFDRMESLFNGEIIIDAKGNPVQGTPGCPNSKELDTCAV